MIATPKYRRVWQFKGFLFILALLIIIGVMFYTNYLVRELRDSVRESLSMNIEHYLFLIEHATPAQAFEEIQRIDVPIILTDAEGNPKFWKNVDVHPADTTAGAEKKLKSLISRMDRISEPIPIEYSEGRVDYFHYGDSNLIVQLQFLPYMGILAVGLFILIGYMGFKHIKNSEQRSVWVGMARETAHQLGTPLSSLLGWTELLKSELSDQRLVSEMEKDISRLEKITARFSQIGSEVKLEPARLLPIIEESVDYYRRRLPHSGRQVELKVDYEEDLSAMVNPQLLGWVLENLIRNGLDAMMGERGSITVALRRGNGWTFIEVIDTGKGIDPSERRNIFRPGYTTKSRGWGVGLSLARRIVEDYHGGKLTMQESQVGQGTMMRIALPGKTG